MLPGAKKDRLFIFYSKSPIDFEQLLKLVQGDPENAASLIKNNFASNLIPSFRIKFNEKEIAFEVSARENELLCFFTDIEYQ